MAGQLEWNHVAGILGFSCSALMVVAAIYFFARAYLTHRDVVGNDAAILAELNERRVEVARLREENERLNIDADILAELNERRNEVARLREENERLKQGREVGSTGIKTSGHF